MDNIFGYARVSATDQNEIRQMIALHEKGVPAPNIYVDKQSGKDFNRPQYTGSYRPSKKGTFCTSSASTGWGGIMRRSSINGGSSRRRSGSISA